MDVITESIAKYVYGRNRPSKEALSTARYCLADSLGCAVAALHYPACTKLLGPVVPGTIVPNGCRLLGTDYVLDPLRAAFDLGSMIRWLDYNDTWLGAEWAHPSDNLGGILSVMDFLGRKNVAEGKEGFTCGDLLHHMIKAYEIQGVLALTNSFNRIGFDHVIFVKVATTAVSAALMGASLSQINDAVSNAWIDVCPLRTYRHAPNTGSRKSWAAGDATRRGVELAWLTMKGEMGYKTAMTAPGWGLYDVLFSGKPFTLARPFGSYVMENVLFKIAFPAEFHAQSAVECAIGLHAKIGKNIEAIRSVVIHTHESAIRIIDKKGPLNNPADRDHCLQYMVAIGLLYGTLEADHYEECIARNPEIDILRNKMQIFENPHFTSDYLHPDKRSIATTIEISFMDNRPKETVTVEYPLGHRKRRHEGIPLIFKKFKENLSNRYSESFIGEMTRLFQDEEQLHALQVPALVDFFCDAPRPDSAG